MIIFIKILILINLIKYLFRCLNRPPKGCENSNQHNLVDEFGIETKETWINVEVDIQDLKQLVEFEVLEMREPLNTFRHC